MNCYFDEEASCSGDESEEIISSGSENSFIVDDDCESDGEDVAYNIIENANDSFVSHTYGKLDLPSSSPIQYTSKIEVIRNEGVLPQPVVQSKSNLRAPLMNESNIVECNYFHYNLF